MRLGCSEVEAVLDSEQKRVERDKGMHVILCLSLSVGPATFSSVSILSRGRECGPYLHRLKVFWDVVIVSGFAVVVVVTVTSRTEEKEAGCS